ncbi:MAG: hypothetical protein JW395_1063 [Nitrospira sp.]|nr:hypothetical protein [Nitrospira sp.]
MSERMKEELLELADRVANLAADREIEEFKDRPLETRVCRALLGPALVDMTQLVPMELICRYLRLHADTMDLMVKGKAEIRKKYGDL